MLKTGKKLLPLAPLLAYCTFSRRKEPKLNGIRPWRPHHCLAGESSRIKNAQFRVRTKNSNLSWTKTRAPSRIPSLKRKTPSQQQNHTPKTSKNSAAFWYQCCTRQCQENETAWVRGRKAVRGGWIAPPPRAAPKPRTDPKITGAETNQEEPGRIPRTHRDCAFVRPPPLPSSSPPSRSRSPQANKGEGNKRRQGKQGSAGART